MSAPLQYRRLARVRGNFSGIHSLWLAETHLIAVRQILYTEHYRRFYFHDIQAITLQETRTRYHFALAWGIGGGLFALLLGGLFALSSGTAGAVAFAICAVLAGLALLINQLLGPTVTLQLVTAVQTTPLPTVRRRRDADKLRLAIHAKILAAQRDLTTVTPAPAPAPASEPAPESAPAPVPEFNS